ncbi:hypothetical protein ASC78_15965 [Variovorax sp. Root318D1]|uniref:hypothetical protein n=1 Tax=Variovorax sp. Root318D1 TaxID=1736513 RepID=UPI0006FFAFC9|nr:hypothetical protein [Variovorax sp. Root318D1]KQU82881.1 hypothetical protein ASC78_15965 [Variovorax sp. Root318D1]
MSSGPTGQPSLVRTGAKAGAAFVGSVIKGGLLALILGGGAFFYYVGQLQGPGNTAARAGGAGAVLALITSPPLLVAVLLLLFVVVYAMLGVQQGRAKAMQHLVAARGEAVSERLAGAIAGRIESMPRTHGTLQRAADWLSVDALSKQLAPVLGEGKAVRSVVGFVLNRLPMSDMLAEWQEGRAAHGEPVTAEGAAQDPALRALLTRRINETLQEMSTPSRKPLYIALGAHAVLLGVGLWLVN